MLFSLQIYVRQQHLHSARALASEHVRFVLYNSILFPQVVLVDVRFLLTLSIVENGEFCAEEIRPYLAKIACVRFLHGV